MKFLHKKNITSFLAYLFFLIPIVADSAEGIEENDGDKEEPMASYKLSYGYSTPKGGKATLKMSIPIDMDTILNCSLNLHESKIFGPIYSSKTKIDENGQAADTQEWLLTSKDLCDAEKVLKWFKGFFGDLYIKQTDETDTQSYMIGIIKDCYNGAQVIGIGFETEDLSLTLDLEGIVRWILCTSTKDDLYKKHGSSFASIKLEWKDLEGFFEEIAVATKIAKGDFASQGSNNNINRFFHGVSLNLKPSEPIFNLLHKLTLTFTNFKNARKEPKDQAPLGALCVSPSVECKMDYGKFTVFGKDAKLNCGIGCVLTDISGVNYQQGPAQNSYIGSLYHLTFTLQLNFKDFCDHKGLSLSPKLSMQWAPNQTYPNTITKRKNLDWQLSLGINHTITLAEYYTL